MTVCISERQRAIHVASEKGAVFVFVPFLLWTATRKRKLTTDERFGLAVAAVATLAIDGYLLGRWKR